MWHHLISSKLPCYLYIMVLTRRASKLIEYKMATTTASTTSCTLTSTTFTTSTWTNSNTQISTTAAPAKENQPILYSSSSQELSLSSESLNETFVTPTFNGMAVQ
ncbi:uncharacterized protein ACRADG_006495 isoform 1-T8 [Cochliomyia hominivorax]